MKATGFLLQNVTNPNTGEESQRIAVKFDNAKVIRLFTGEQSLDEFKATITPESRESILKRIVVRDGEFGEYCVVSRAITTEEF